MKVTTPVYHFPQYEKQARDLIKKYDTDGNGAISRQESLAREKTYLSPDTFTRLDENKDEQLTASELADRYGRVLDSNKDGKVSFWENLLYKHGFTAAIEDPYPYKPAPPVVPQPKFPFPEFEKLAAGLIKKYDADGDGMISGKEAAETKKSRISPKRLAELDENQDGKLSASELANRYGRRLDSNKDGKVSFWEKLVDKYSFAEVIEEGTYNKG